MYKTLSLWYASKKSSGLDTGASENCSRIFLLDELRGFLILYVAAYHLLYDLQLFGFVDSDWFFSPFMENLRNFFVAMLIMISGICSHLSRSNLKRGVKTLAAGLMITAVTYLFIPEQMILFGILHFFGCAMLVYALIKKPLSKVNAPLGFCVSILLFFLTFDIYDGVFGFAGLGMTVQLPDFLYNHPLLYALGFRCEGLHSADYYPLLPWIFVFLAGSFCGKAVKDGRFPAFFYRSHVPKLALIGRHTLLIYIVHQPLLYGLVWLSSFLLK